MNGFPGRKRYCIISMSVLDGPGRTISESYDALLAHCTCCIQRILSL